MRRRHLEYTRSTERLPRRRAPSGCPKQIARAGTRNPGSCPSRSSQCRCFSSTVEGSLRSEPRPPALLPAVSKESSGAKGATCNFSRCLTEHLIAILLCSLAKNSPFHHDITVSHQVISSVAEFLVVESIDIVRPGGLRFDRSRGHGRCGFEDCGSRLLVAVRQLRPSAVDDHCEGELQRNDC